MFDRPLHAAQELGVRVAAADGRNMPDRRPGDDEAKLVDRIGGARDEDDIRPGAVIRLSHVGEAFLRAEGRHHLECRVEFHAEATRV